MKAHQFVGYALLNASAITAITSTRIYYGLRPSSSAASSLPCINYYEVGGGIRRNGVKSQTFSINCRATAAPDAKNLAEIVMDVFAGSSGTGMHGTMNAFDASRLSLRNDGGIIPEPSDNLYNSPIDILLACPVDTIS